MAFSQLMLDPPPTHLPLGTTTGLPIKASLGWEIWNEKTLVSGVKFFGNNAG